AARFLTQIEIHPGADLGRRLFIDHGSGVVIGETAVVGDDVTLYHGVTLGGTSLHEGRRHPTVGDGVVVGAGAKVLGAIDIGPGARVGANAVLVKSVDSDSVVVGVPGQVVVANHAETRAADPDPLAFAVRSLLRRVAKLEERDERIAEPALPLYRDDGVWEPTDYAI
ncbi:MAG: serine O-acetyltransferase EpsC, partial [Candidatus Nanopelagicales bacterium]